MLLILLFRYSCSVFHIIKNPVGHIHILFESVIEDTSIIYFNWGEPERAPHQRVVWYNRHVHKNLRGNTD